MPEVVVVTTKPQLNEAEYGIKSESGEWIVHGIVIPVGISELSDEDAQKLNDARAVLLALAQEDAQSKGLI